MGSDLGRNESFLDNENDRMMEAKKNNRTKWVHLRLRLDEYKTIMNFFDKSTCRKLSEYARLQLLKKPIVERYRNESLDNLMMEIIVLRKELNAIGNNFNQSVKKLHTMDNLSEIKDWLFRFELDKKTIAAKLDEVKKGIHKISEVWLQ